MLYLLDTSALKWAYLGHSKFHRRCRYLMSRCQGRVYIAEISILELVSALGYQVRGKRITVREYAAANRQFLRDIAAERLIIRLFPSSQYVGCRQLLALVGIDAGRNLATQDSIVAYTARFLAQESKSIVHLLTSDQKLARVVDEVAIFEGLVTSEYLDPN